MAFLLAVLLTLGAAGAIVQTPNAQPSDARAVIAKAIANVDKNEKIADDYNYKQRQVVRFLDSKGQVKKTEIKTYDVLQIEGTEWRRLVAKDDKPLPPNEERKEQERVDKETRKRAGESAADREKRLAKHKKEQQDEEDLNREIVEAFEWRLAGHETINTVPCVLIEAKPKPGYQPRKKQAGILKHFAGRVWISEDTNNFVKLDANVLDDISFGWFLAKLHKGSHLLLEQAHINEEVWLPRAFSVKIGARALIKQLNIEAEATYSDYKKFRVDSKITGIAEEKPQ